MTYRTFSGQLQVIDAAGLRKVASELVGYGYTTPSGKPYSAAAVASMLQP
jgi:hypothetical protein